MSPQTADRIRAVWTVVGTVICMAFVIAIFRIPTP